MHYITEIGRREREQLRSEVRGQSVFSRIGRNLCAAIHYKINKLLHHCSLDVDCMLTYRLYRVQSDAAGSRTLTVKIATL